MHYVKHSLLAMLLTSASLLITSGCAATSKLSSPPAVEPPKLAPLPSQLSAIDPPPSGTYSRKLTESREKWRTQLNATQKRLEQPNGSSNSIGK